MKVWTMYKSFRFCAVSVVLVVCAAAQTATTPKRASNAVWITNVYLVSPESLDHIEKGSVLIEDGRIARVERGRLDRGKTAKKPAGDITSPALSAS